MDVASDRMSLLDAIFDDNPATLSALLQQGESATLTASERESEAENYGASLLIKSIQYGRAHAAQLLLSRLPLLAREPDLRGWQPLHWCAAVGDEATARLLLKRHRVPLDSRDEVGRTPLHLAAKEGRATLALLLLTAAREAQQPPEDLILATDDRSLSPIETARAHGHVVLADALQDIVGRPLMNEIQDMADAAPSQEVQSCCASSAPTPTPMPVAPIVPIVPIVTQDEVGECAANATSIESTNSTVEAKGGCCGSNKTRIHIASHKIMLHRHLWMLTVL
ncbi:hypothetical protein CAOG_07571 [Capsaspora owczarzaki ATCC 30864]|uniref:hypothetical protein n=1 Tax=Capsaspora owczarzaki (strain ATCC 30864) TaxID=595528 RepID=UPI0003526B08|nr:hypothetical protein CAOG_07571 [Capsaspora owczarzaki ATCC 30864]|eukprot:XP_004343445.2 hypothetical protein CAOG_07571 [Capsaspora owczarzaki ATCC 30864]